MEEESREPVPVGDRQDGHLENGIISDNSEGTSLTADEATNAAGVGKFQIKLLILSGFVWMARGFEFVILMNIHSLITCTWNLKRWEAALMETVTWWSMILGCIVFGIWSDTYGRRTALSSSLIFLFVFGAVSAGLPTYSWFVIFRAVIGFATGGLVQTLVLICEFTPSRQRGRAIYILALFWALGIVIMLSVLYAVLDSEGNWRMLVAIGALPSFLAMVMMRFFPESFRFLMVTNQYFAANEIFAEMSENNGNPVPGRLTPLPQGRKRAITTNLLSPPLGRPTVILWLLGLSSAISFMGLETLSPQMIRHGTERFNGVSVKTTNFLGSQYSLIPCMKMTTEVFVFKVWTTSLDFPGYVIYFILVDLIDRKKLLCASYLISSFFIFLLCIPAPGLMIHVAFLYCARILHEGLLPIILLITAELYPTSHRGTAVGLQTSAICLGWFLSSYIVQSLLLKSLLYPIILYGLLSFFCGLTTLLLKRETRGKDLQDVL